MTEPTKADRRTAAERIEDLAFENRIRFLTHHRRWQELQAVQMVYASALADRENPPPEPDRWSGRPRTEDEVALGELVGDDAPA
jgi:hypothetical protein